MGIKIPSKFTVSSRRITGYSSRFIDFIGITLSGISFLP
jgi:hypothetical protein